MSLVAIAIAGCDNDDDRLKAEEASLDELHQEFENVCSVRMYLKHTQATTTGRQSRLSLPTFPPMPLLSQTKTDYFQYM